MIIVSGDIIQGIRLDVSDPEKKLREQYQEALDFLSKLTDRFVGGDRNRVIVVPGNRDVSAYHFDKSLAR
jgi:3',5'-cyclic AMP phosphodiesterase CpdA